MENLIQSFHHPSSFTTTPSALDSSKVDTSCKVSVNNKERASLAPFHSIIVRTDGFHLIGGVSLRELGRSLLDGFRGVMLFGSGGMIGVFGLPLVVESLSSGPGAYDQSLEALPTQSAAYESESRIASHVLYTMISMASEAPDESPDSSYRYGQASRTHWPPPPTIIYRLLEILCIRLIGAQQALDPSIDLSHGHRSMPVELSPISYLEHIVDKCNLLRGGCSDSGISSLRSTGDGMDRDGGSGGNEGGDDGGKGGECAGRAVHLARRSPAEGGDSEIGGDGDGVVMGNRFIKAGMPVESARKKGYSAPLPPRPPHLLSSSHPWQLSLDDTPSYIHLHHLPRP
ncbi:hypothetical protein Tco_0529828 [Tanacetum coccineum]